MYTSYNTLRFKLFSRLFIQNIRKVRRLTSKTMPTASVSGDIPGFWKKGRDKVMSVFASSLY